MLTAAPNGWGEGGGVNKVVPQVVKSKLNQFGLGSIGSQPN